MPEISFPAALILALVKPLAGPNYVPFRSKDDVCRDLRAIRFNDNGILNVIRSILDGKEITEKERNVIRRFADAEWRVQGALKRLIMDVGSVSRLKQQQLAEIEYGKADVRRALGDILYSYSSLGGEVDLVALEQAYGSILYLNSEIDRIEDILKHGNG